MYQFEIASSKKRNATDSRETDSSDGVGPIAGILSTIDGLDKIRDAVSEIFSPSKIYDTVAEIDTKAIRQLPERFSHV